MTTTESKPVIALIYTGKRRTVRGTTIHSYLHEQDGTETQRLFSKALYPCSVGGRLSITATDDLTQVFPDSAKYLGRVDRDDPRLVEWAAEDEAAEQDAKAAATKRKAGQADPLEALLDELRRNTRNLNKPQRRALASRIMEALYL